MARHRLPLIPITAQVLPDAANRSDTYRWLAWHALTHSLPLEKVSSDSFDTAVIFLPQPLEDRISVVSETHDCSLQVAFAMLCLAAMEALTQRHSEEKSTRSSAIERGQDLFLPRDENQRRYMNNLIGGLAAKKIVFAEGSTGVGKSRALMASAVYQVLNGIKPVIVAAPTLEVVRHLYDEYLKLGSHDARLIIAPGAHEFVDPDKLRDILDAQRVAAASSDDIPLPDAAIEQWINQGGEVLAPTALTTALTTFGIQPRWMMDDLRTIADNIDVSQAVLSADSSLASNEGRRILEQCREAAKQSADIILMTHTMLGIGQLTQWTIVPEPRCILIDEAHLLEQAIANLHSDSLSLFSMRVRLIRHIQETGSSTRVLKQLLKLIKGLQQALMAVEASSNARVRLDEPSGSEEQSLADNVLTTLKTLAPMYSNKALDDMPMRHEDIAAIKSLIHAFSPGNGQQVHVEFSPDRRFPSLRTGPSRLGRELGALWSAADEGVALASATLSVMDINGNSSVDYLREILAIPLTRADTPSPVVSKHIYQLPTLFTPSPVRAEMLIPPSPDQPGAGYDLDETTWLSHASRVIARFAATSKGGMLVLCTAYSQIEKLSRLLPSHGTGDQVIVVQKRGGKFATTRDTFVRLAKQGRRPILLGIGAAWTGLDLADREVPAERDFLLTDLVILRMPLGLNRTSSMNARIDRLGVFPIIREALLMLKQGLGRLIRRNGVLHRRIIILDGRVWHTNWEGMQTFVGTVRRMLMEYQSHERFD